MSEDQFGTDFSAVRAHAALELHMKECTERRAEDRADRSTMHARLNAMQESFDKRMGELTESFDKRMGEFGASSDKRMTSISNRMWAAAAALISALAVVAFHFATKGH